MTGGPGAGGKSQNGLGPSRKKAAPDIVIHDAFPSGLSSCSHFDPTCWTKNLTFGIRAGVMLLSPFFRFGPGARSREPSADQSHPTLQRIEAELAGRREGGASQGQLVIRT